MIGAEDESIEYSLAQEEMLVGKVLDNLPCYQCFAVRQVVFFQA